MSPALLYMSEIRFDYGLVQGSQRNADGSLRVWATVSHVGALQYAEPTGSRRTEYVDKADLFEPASLNTLAGIPFVSPHSKDLVPSKSEIKGSVLSQHIADHDRGALLTDVVIWDADTIKEIEEGRITGLSLGYKCDLEKREDGKLYQTNRRYYHLAGVKVPRAVNARFHLDSQDPVEDPEIPVMNGVLYHAQKRDDALGSREDFLALGEKYHWDCKPGCDCKRKKRGKKKMKLNFDGIETEVDDSVGVVFQALLARMDAISTRLDMVMQRDPEDDEDEEEEEDVPRKSGKNYKDHLDALEGERDALRAIVDRLDESEEDESEEDEDEEDDEDEEEDEEKEDGKMDSAAIASKIRLITEAAPLLPDYRIDDLAEMSPTAIKRLAIAAMSSRFDIADLETRPPAAIDAIYETLSQNRIRTDAAQRRSLADVVRQDRGVAPPGAVSAAAHAKFASNYKSFLNS